MEKILFISNIAKKVGSFSKASIDAARENGLQFHMAANWEQAGDEQIKSDEKQYNVKIHNIPLARSPYSRNNIKAFKELVKIIQLENIEYIHCNTPVGGILGRLAGRKCKVKKVIYQAHGFHFYKGAPLKNWLLYYPVERWLAHYTDAIITINNEDFERAKKFKLRNHGKVYYVPGVGIDTSQYNSDKQQRLEKREELGLKGDDIALISMGDLIERKNYPVAIEAIAEANNSHLHYYICGQGPDEEKLIPLAKKLGIEAQIHFLEYRTDIKELLQASDIFLFTSLQEGLARSLMEAMASGLPCIASRIRGNTDLLNDSNGGILCDSLRDYVEAIDKLSKDSLLRKQMSVNNIEAIQHYSVGEISRKLEDIYTNEISECVWGGISLNDYIPDWAKKRMEISIPLNAVILISVGELNENKNNQVIIRALGKLNDKNVHYVLCGVGSKESELKDLAQEMGVAKNVHFLGYRADVKELMNSSDIFVMPSFREGLSRSIMEAMAGGLPCVVSRIRGNVDLVKDGENGYTVVANDVVGFTAKIDELIRDESLRTYMTERNLRRITDFDIKTVKDIIGKIYREELRLNDENR